MAKPVDPKEGGEKEMTLSGIKNMTKGEILKGFKSGKNLWKNASKCKAALFLLAFAKNKDKKKVTIALPFKTEMAMKTEFKELKKTALLPMKQVAGGTVAVAVGSDGKEELRVEITNGGANLQKLETLVNKLFKGIKLRVVLQVAANAELEAPSNDDTDDDLNDDDDEGQVEDQSEEGNDDQDQSGKEQRQVDAVFEALKKGWGDLSKKIKESVPSIVNKLKSKQAGSEESDLLQQVEQEAKSWKERYEGLADALKKPLEGAYKVLEPALMQFNQIRQALEKMLNNPNQDPSKKEAQVDDSSFQKLLEQIGNMVKEVSGEVSKAGQTLKDLPKKVLKSGKDFLSDL